MKQCGIYSIICIPTGKRYIGSSVDLDKRRRDHMSDLRREQHRNPYLQAAYNKHGQDAFIFEVIELTTIEARLEREDYWIRCLNAADRTYGYNLEPKASSPAHSPETRAKIADSMRNGPSAAARSEMMKARMADPVYAAKVAKSRGSPQRRAKMSAIMKKRMTDPEYRAKIRQGQLLPEARARAAAANRRNMQNADITAKLSKTWVVIDPEGNSHIVTNLSAFCRKHGLSMANMSAVARGRQSHCKGWKCVYAE